jgi:hypothetical protein
MINDGVSLVKTFRRDDVLVGDAFVLVGRPAAVAMEPDVMLLRDLAELLVVRHIDSFLTLHPVILSPAKNL